MTDAHHHHHHHAHAPAHAVADRRWRRIDLGFTAGAGLRLAVAALFAIAAIGSAMVVGDGGGHPPSTPAPLVAASATSASPCTLEIESTYPVSHWTLLSDGKPLVATAATARLWRGEIAGRATIMVEAEDADPLDSSLTALRIRFHAGDWNHRVEVWGRGSVSTTVTWPGQVPTAAKP